MSEAEEPKPTTEGQNAATAKRRGKWMRGCGCLSGLLLLGLGILIIGNFDSTSWASALIAIVIGVLVFSMSGVNGIWEDD